MGVGGGGLGVGEYGASGDVCYLKIIRKYNTKANNTFFERKKIQNSMKRYNTTRDNRYMSKSIMCYKVITYFEIASKHFCRCGWTACGLRVCERISRSSSLDKK